MQPRASVSELKPWLLYYFRMQPDESRNSRTCDCDICVPSDRVCSLVRFPEYGSAVMAVSVRVSGVTEIEIGPPRD